MAYPGFALPTAVMKTSNDQVPPPKKGKTWLSKTLAWIHLWPSLVSAVILIFVCLTGTIIVYCDEIIDFVNRDALYAASATGEKLPTETLLANFRETYPDRRNPGYMVTYRDPARTVKFNSFDKEKGLRFVYMDPYTGQVVKDDGTIYFFYITAHLHNSLLWHGPGNWIIDIATLIFLIELITGLILWWPVKWSKATRDASFKIRWKARFKRLNYDLHNVLGFYALAICMVLTVTGLIIAFKPLSTFTIRSFGGDPGHEWEETLTPYNAGLSPAPLNTIFEQTFARYPQQEALQVATYKIDSSGHFGMNVSKRVGLKSCEDCFPLMIDRYTGQPIAIPRTAELHEIIENTYWALHMGTWMGQTGKFVTFTGGLIATSLPITGFLIWWGRRKKKKKAAPLHSSRNKARTGKRPTFVRNP